MARPGTLHSLRTRSGGGIYWVQSYMLSFKLPNDLVKKGGGLLQAALRILPAAAMNVRPSAMNVHPSATAEECDAWVAFMRTAPVDNVLRRWQ